MSCIDEGSSRENGEENSSYVTFKQSSEDKLPQVTGNSTSPLVSSQHLSILQKQLQEMLQVGQKCLQSIAPITSTTEQVVEDQAEIEKIKTLEEELCKTRQQLLSRDNDYQKQQNLVATLSQKCRGLSDDNTRLTAENNELKQRVTECEARATEAQQHVQRTVQSPADREHIEMLQAQLVFYKEDFESERRDRERAQSRLADVEQKLSLAQRQLQQYEMQSMQSLAQRREAALSLHREEYERKQQPVAPSSSLVSRGVYQSDGPSEGYDEIDCGGACASPVISLHCDRDLSDELLCCPNCKKPFTVDQHSDLLEHIEICSL